MVDLLAKKKQDIKTGTVFEYNGEQYYTIDVVNNIASKRVKMVNI